MASIPRRTIIGGLAALAVAPAAAQGPGGKRAVVGFSGLLTPANAPRFVGELRRRLNQTIFVDVAVDRPSRRGGALVVGSGGGGRLTLVVKSGGRTTTVAVSGGNRLVESDPDRYVISGFFDCYVDRTDGDPNSITLERIAPEFSDPRFRFPSIRL
jgi:hypothetical protein